MLKQRGPTLTSTIKPALTAEGLKTKLKPENTCAIKSFLDTLDESSREQLEQAFSLDPKLLTSAGIREWVIETGFDSVTVPRVESFQNHRSGKGSCKCRV